MKKYIVTAGSITIHPGTIVKFMNDDQAKIRKHVTETRKDGTFQCIKPFQFKRGEIFESNFIPPKSVRQHIEETEKTPEQVTDDEKVIPLGIEKKKTPEKKVMKKEPEKKVVKKFTKDKKI